MAKKCCKADEFSVGAETKFMTLDKLYTRTEPGGKKVVLSETTDEHPVTIPCYPEGAPVGSVSVGMSKTFNMGQYESLKLSCHLTVPTIAQEVQDAYDFATGIVSELLAKEFAEVEEMRKK